MIAADCNSSQANGGPARRRRNLNPTLDSWLATACLNITAGLLEFLNTVVNIIIINYFILFM